MKHIIVHKLVQRLFLAMLFIICVSFTFYFSLRVLLGHSQTVIVPNMVGKDVLVAMEEFAKEDIRFRVEKVTYDDTVDKGIIISQKPRPGSRVKSSRVIGLRVSRGLRQLSVPNVVGMDAKVARQIMQNNGTAVKKMLHSCAQVRKNYVISQYPEHDKEANKESGVTLLISTGPCNRYFVMPNYKRQDIAQTTDLLESADIPYLLTESAATYATPKNSIVSQAPSAGSIIDSETIVHFTMAAEKNAFGRKIDLRYLRYKVAFGFSERQFQVRYGASNLRWLNIDKRVPPGKTIQQVIVSYAGRSAALYLDQQPVLFTKNIGLLK